MSSLGLAKRSYLGGQPLFRSALIRSIRAIRVSDVLSGRLNLSRSACCIESQGAAASEQNGLLELLEQA